MPSETITIELSYEDAELFKRFREYQDVFKQLLEGGAFEVRNGSILIHSDHKDLKKFEITTVHKIR